MCGRAKWLLLILKKQLSWFSNFLVVLVLVVVLTDQTTETTLFVSSNLQMILILIHKIKTPVGVWASSINLKGAMSAGEHAL